MRLEVKKWIGRCAIKLGQYSVGKSTLPGLYDPKIPEALKKEMKRVSQQSKK